MVVAESIPKNAHILILDDSSFDLECMRRQCVLWLRNFRITCCTLPEQATRVLENEAVDLLLVDVQMPNFNIVDFAKAVSKRWKNTAIVAVSSDNTGQLILSIMET